MRFLEVPADAPAAELALDEALLEAANENESQVDLLRLWELTTPAVIIGRASRATDEVHLDFCHASGIPVLRRASGGCAIVAGPGCWMYSLVLSLNIRPELRDIAQAHAFVLDRIAGSLRGHGAPASRAGTSDLILQADGGSRKFSGNSLRLKPHALLYHGTILYDFPLERASRALRTPPREPEYRAGREHGRFIANLPLSRETIRQALLEAFDAREAAGPPPPEAVARLVAEKYSRDEWNLRH